MKSTVYLLVIAMFGFSSLVYAGTIDPDTPDEKYLNYGNQFPYVVKIVCSDTNNQLFYGSAVVIDKHWILTAAHVVKNSNRWKIISDEDVEYTISNMILHPDYIPENYGFNDIAIGFIQKPLLINYYPQFYESDNETGKNCSISGWGLTGTFLNRKDLRYDSKRRSGTNVIDSINYQTLVCSPSRRSEGATELEYLVADGDSGGGLFIDGKLAGINSFLERRKINGEENDLSAYRQTSHHSRVSIHTPWIKRTIASK
jgi:hypothetical protein